MTALTASPNPAVLSYMAPAVRVELLDADLVGGPEAGKALEASIAADIQKIQVTLEHTGCSQYSITLSNWRTAPDPRTTNGASRGSGVTTTWPRYKYNDFAAFKFGQRLRLSMRYWPDRHRSESEATIRAHAWVPMIAGPITDMQFTFGDRAELTLTGEDDLSRLKDKCKTRQEFTDASRSELDIVDRVLEIAGFPLKTRASPRVEFPSFASEAGQAVAEGLQDGQSYLEYLTKLAERLDAEIFIAFADLSATVPEQVFHFEPARSRARYDDPAGETITLRRDETLIDLTPTIKVADQPTGVEIRGRHRDRARPERVSQENDETEAILADELQYDPELEPEPMAGPVVRQQFFPGRDNPLIISNETNTDDERAKFAANTELRRKAREFLTIQLSTVGLPRLRPGNYVEVRGLRDPFDGFYYVTKAVHTFDGSGLRTAVTARRPGMPMPEGGLA